MWGPILNFNPNPPPADQAALLLQQNRHCSVPAVRHAKIELPIAIKIRSRNSDRKVPHRKRRTGRLSEGPVAIPKQERHRVIAQVRSGKVQLPIVIKVSRDHLTRPISHCKSNRRLECPVAISEQHGNGVGSLIRHRQVQLPVAVKVSRNNRRQALSKRNWRLSRLSECPISIAERDRYSRIW